MESTCKGCHKDLLGLPYKKVGNWLFCPECFHKLMNSAPRSEEPAPRPSPEAEPKREAAEERPWLDLETKLEVSCESPHCRVCGKELKGDAKALGDWRFCRDCYLDLMPGVAPETPAASGKERDVESAAGTPDTLDAAPEAKPGTPGDKVCKGCSRRLVHGGYKEIGSDPYCPDCYYAIVDILQQVQGTERPPAGRVEARPLSTITKPHITKDRASVSHASPGQTECQSCLLPVRDAEMQVVEGFQICRACLATDAESAVKIARSRHKKRMQRMREELEG